jgi:hypothetical protein
MHKLKIKSIHPINKSNHQINNPPPTSGDERRHPPPFAAHLRRLSANKKKKKDKSGHWGWPRSTPTARGRDPATLSGLFGEPTKKKKIR